MEEPNGLRGAPSRADYLEDADGLKCLEYNAGGFLGGMQLNDFGNLYLACPPIARFLEAKGRRARAPDTLAALFRHQVEEAVRLGAWSAGEFNVAVVNRPNPEQWAAMFVEEVYTEALRRVLEERGMAGGRALVCDAGDFREENGSLYVGDHPVHLVLEFHSGAVRLRVQYRYFKTRRLQITSEPMGRILSDKGNLALLSENARSDELTAEERALVERHIPWTRRVAPMRTAFRGRGMRLPDDLAERRADLVLKKSNSISGRAVLVGRFRTDAEWRDDVARAVREEDWIVQEYLESVPCCFQAGERGATRHDVVWGLFAFGDHFGGVFTRMVPHMEESGVVNTSRGAQEGTFLELED
jgi:hypothetical protein